MRLFAIILFFISRAVVAQVSIEVIPKAPAVNEVFQILFKCNVEGRDEPEINFSPKGFEVLGKQSQGVSTRTTYQAGKITVTREVLVSFTAVSKKVGTGTIQSPSILIGSKAYNKEDISFQILDKPAAPKVVFVSADVSKDEVYVNEGITLRYYLYRKVPIQATDIKKYPKLETFMKRYLQENENPQRVSINGDIYTRSTLYSARLYPEKPGDFIIDPIALSATYSKDNMGAFGFGFGLSRRDLVTANIESEPITIKVIPLPEQGKPENFSGLVGSHKFDLIVGRTNLLVNEPLELKLSINGPGKLESFSPVNIFNRSEIEQFDVKADLALIGSEGAVKTFTYTFLGKENAAIPESELSISYFDVETKKYEIWRHTLPEIRIAGGDNIVVPVGEGESVEKAEVAEKSKKIILIKSESANFWFMVAAFFIATLLVFWKLIRATLPVSNKSDSSLSDAIRRLKKGTYSHKELAQVFSAFSQIDKGGVRELIINTKLEDEVKSYFIDILNGLETIGESNDTKQKKKVASRMLKKVLDLKQSSL